MDIVSTLAEELGLKPEAVSAAVGLIDEGNTIPFIARYRKEATGGMDDVALRASRSVWATCATSSNASATSFSSSRSRASSRPSSRQR